LGTIRKPVAVEPHKPFAYWLLVTTLLLHAAPFVRAATSVLAWVQRYGGPTNAGAAAQALAVDATGNAYVTGGSVGTSGYPEFTTIAYSSAGEASWTNVYRGSGSSQASAIGLDPVTGNIFVAGESDRSSPLENDIATIAYSSTGVPLWTNRYNAPTSCCVTLAGLALGSNGNVYIAGSVGGLAADYATVAYSSGGLALWTNRYSGPGYDIDALEAIAVGANGNVYVTGFSNDRATGERYVTIAYSGEGTSLWTNRYGGPASRDHYAIAVAASVSNVYVTGSSDGESSGKDYATIAYSSGGGSLWTNRYNGPANSNDLAAAVCVDQQENVYVTGASMNAFGNYDYATVAYTSTGAPIWTNRYGIEGKSSNSARGIAVDSKGNIAVTGWSAPNGAPRDYATVGYSAAGQPLWTNRYNGPANGHDYPIGPSCLAVGPNGAVFVTGSSEGIHDGATNGEFATIKYVPAPDIRFRKIHPLPDATYQLNIVAPTNTTYRLEASSDLLSWLPLTNFPPLPVVRLQYTDTSATNFPRRFYRTVWGP
jgi:hypothetical protein